jgi:hypothetical protein
MANGLKLIAWLGLGTLGTWVLSGCQEDITVVLDSDLIPVEAQSIEVTLPFHSFAKDLEGWGGYGRPYELPNEILAKEFEGGLEARVLNAWNNYPVATTVRDSLGNFGTDSTLTFVSGRVIARFDTLTSIHGDSVTLAISAIPRNWDFRSVNWNMAVDSVGDAQPWDVPGADPATAVATSVWDPSLADSVVFQLDSAAVATWADTVDAGNGVRLDVVTEGTRLDLVSLIYLLDTRPSSHPDTLVELAVGSRGRTFIYHPVLEEAEGEIRVGGVPAWRTLFTMDLPEALDGPAELCAIVPCPYTVTVESVSSAALILTTRAPPPGFQPTDTLFMDVRPVLEPSRLPKSPLGNSLAGARGIRLTPDQFGEGVGAKIEVPLSSYVQGLVAERTTPELEIPHTLALLSAFEPLSLYFAAFEGPDSPAPPELRLILTLADTVKIR